ncbi:hypothetical protein MTsPCn9_29400 [Croceitalea sp. MTPC9]|uniref:universal stress protein n=1 Tax=unclassified Croceitalea TaxID=2632280 RepID=UPI002B3A4144|nr:hypothetical protein MTsPCn6_30890 [Croceitalea sp. MTPC6]GMN18000.1 hypothetical protein MTsPCn9_29400 [Croceitalea sp. MTPC9]
MKRILLPTDFSDNAFKAITYALRVFENMECTFYLFHTYNPPVYEVEYLLLHPSDFGLGDEYLENSQTKLIELQRSLEEQFKNPKHKFLIHTAFNSFLNEVLDTVENESIDYVVMGTKGATGAREILLGTNTVHVIKRVMRPVIAVPPNYEYEAPKEILFPTDYEIEYPKGKFEPLLEIAEQHRSRINVMHVSTGYELTKNQKEHQQSLKKLLGSTALFHDLPSDDVIHAINTFHTQENINLLVMVQNKHTFFERLFIEPVIKKIGFHITLPFMVIPHL